MSESNNKFELSGTIKEVFPPEKKSEKFTLHQFILTTDEKIPQDISFQATGSLADNLSKYATVGEQVVVSFNVGGSFYNGRYFVNLKAWKITR